MSPPMAAWPPVQATLLSRQASQAGRSRTQAHCLLTPASTQIVDLATGAVLRSLDGVSCPQCRLWHARAGLQAHLLCAAGRGGCDSPDAQPLRGQGVQRVT